MSGAMENRAAVFTNSAQDVEVYRARAWEPGSMLGWRHAPDGSCQAWVRLAAGGGEDAVWIDLADVRLPEPPLRSVEDTLVGGVRTLAGVPSPRSGAVSGGSGLSEVTATMSLVAVRDGAGASKGATPARNKGGRRRAPEADAGNSAAAYWAALDASGTRAPEGPATPGRHRAPASGAFGAGRHRAADTGMMPAVRVAERSADAAPRNVTAATVVPVGPVDDEPDAHLYTRPLRLTTTVAQPRSSGRGDGF